MKETKKISKTPKQVLVMSEMNCHSLVVKIQHCTYGCVMYECGRVQALRKPFPSTSCKSLIDKYNAL